MTSHWWSRRAIKWREEESVCVYSRREILLNTFHSIKMWRCAAQEEVASLQLEQFTWWFDGCPRNGTFRLFLHSTQHSCLRLEQFHHSNSLSRANFPRNHSSVCCTHICQMPQEMWKTKAKNLKVDRFSILSFLCASCWRWGDEKAFGKLHN